MLISIHTLFFGSVQSIVTPLTNGAAASRQLEWGTAASGLYEGDFAPSVYIYRMTYHNRMVLWHVRRGSTLLRGVPQSRTAPPPAPGGGGGNGRVWSTWSGFSCGFGPNVAPRCPSGPTRHNRVERSTGQSPFVQSQRARSRGQTSQG